MKVGIALSSWSWCGSHAPGSEPAAAAADNATVEASTLGENDTNISAVEEVPEQEGAYVDVAVVIRGSKLKPKPTKRGSLTFRLGGGVLVELPKRVSVDGKEVKVPRHFPKVRKTNAGWAFVVRFPRFQTSAVYEPLLRMSASSSVNPPSTTATTTPQITGPVLGGGSVVVHVDRLGGRFWASARGHDASAEQDPDGVSVRLLDLQEVDANGKPVGANDKKRKHAVANFTEEQFAVAGPQKAKIGSAQSNWFTASAPVRGNSDVALKVYAITREGMLGPDGNEWSAAAGDVFWHIHLSSWHWCGCKRGLAVQTGEFLDLAFAVDSAEQPTHIGGTHGHAWDLGGGVHLELPNVIDIDGTDVALPEGFPHFEERASGAVFVLRVPKFTGKATYESLLRTSASGTAAEEAWTHSYSSGATGRHVSPGAHVFLALLAVAVSAVLA